MNHSLPASRGWTLVELMVAMTLSLLVIAGISQIYLAAKQSYGIQNSLAELQDVGRYVTELLTQDIHNAGYWGLLTSSAGVTNSTPPSASCNNGDTTWGTMVQQKVFGFDNTQNPTGYACIDSSRTVGDVLTVRYGNPSTTTPYTGSGLYIRTTPTSGDIEFGPDVAGATPPPPIIDLELTAHVYYLASSAQAHECEGTSPSPLPALARESLVTSGPNRGTPYEQELVTGVEELQFQFGVDTDGDGSVNKFLDANNVSDWSQVKAVRFWVLVRDDCPESDYTDNKTYDMGNRSYSPNDHYRRALYTSTATLRN